MPPPPLTSTTYILAKVRRSTTADLEPIPLHELARAALGALTNITALQMFQAEQGELLIHFRWSGVGSFRIPEDVLVRYGLAMELDFVAEPASRIASNAGPET
ncbi:hypothetical protein PRJ39_06200 [Lysobacter enzymogenes]|uniref:hypothetical protein n=1 Tax=Lysobacter enzymogenes TaxID=69 RepID=UPI003747D28A